MSNRCAAIVASLLAFALAACAHSPAHPHASAPAQAPERISAYGCDPPLRPMIRDTLYLGRNRPGGTVSDAEWREFVETVVVPRFPQGFTAVPAEGYWRGHNGATGREGSVLLIVLHENSAEGESAVRAVAADYIRRFAQEAVLRERTRACVGTQQEA